MNKKQEVGSRLKRFREDKGMSQRSLAEKCGWGASRIGNYEAGVRSINLDDAEVIAKHLDIKPYQILFDSEDLIEFANVSKIDIQPSYIQKFPVLSSVQAGAWTEAVESYPPVDADEWYETTERTSKRCFWLRVQGDSMTSAIGLSFPEGTLVLVDPEREFENGSLVVAKLIDVNEATFKKLVIDAGQKFLKPLNPSYPTLPINGNCKIIGVVVDAKMKLF
ncbi:LexA family protein [Photobacterium ganghwense]|uniref:LexA family protein n=1 Tax=Photobacterium ganghwense TaxID=320778 RepID=UPI0039EFE42C